MRNRKKFLQWKTFLNARKVQAVLTTFPACAAIEPGRAEALPRMWTEPPRSMITHGVATGSRCCHFRANTSARQKTHWRQPGAPGIVVADRIEGDDGKAAFFGLEANVGSVEMKPERGIKSQGRISSNDQQQLVECGDLGWQLMAVEEFVAAMDNPADSVDGKRRRLDRGGLLPSLAGPASDGSPGALSRAPTP